MNQRMKDQFAAGLATSAVSMPADLVRLIDDGFEEIDGSVFFRRLAKRAATSKASDFPDRTGRECFVNHVHVDDYAESTSSSDFAAVGVAFAKKLEDALRKRGDHYTVIVSADDQSCSVRFHKARSGESWLADDLESYRDESVLALDV